MRKFHGKVRLISKDGDKVVRSDVTYCFLTNKDKLVRTKNRKKILNYLGKKERPKS